MSTKRFLSDSESDPSTSTACRFPIPNNFFFFFFIFLWCYKNCIKIRMAVWAAHSTPHIPGEDLAAMQAEFSLFVRTGQNTAIALSLQECPNKVVLLGFSENTERVLISLYSHLLYFFSYTGTLTFVTFVFILLFIKILLTFLIWCFGNNVC